MKLKLRDVEVFKPYPNEFPEELLVDAQVSDEIIERWHDAPILRVAKRGDEVLGVYAMSQRLPLDESLAAVPEASGGQQISRRSGWAFLLYGVVIAPQVRRQGLGRWLIGHAIGVAESKGGQQLWLAQSGGSRCFNKLGFTGHTYPEPYAQIPDAMLPNMQTGQELLRFDMIQE